MYGQEEVEEEEEDWSGPNPLEELRSTSDRTRRAELLQALDRTWRVRCAAPHALEPASSCLS
jgi:hypothetical protein